MTIRDFISVFAACELFAIANRLSFVYHGNAANVPNDMLDIPVDHVHTEDGRIVIEI